MNNINDLVLTTLEKLLKKTKDSEKSMVAVTYHDTYKFTIVDLPNGRQISVNMEKIPEEKNMVSERQLLYIAHESIVNDKSQKDIAKVLGVSTSVVADRRRMIMGVILGHIDYVITHYQKVPAGCKAQLRNLYTHNESVFDNCDGDLCVYKFRRSDWRYIGPTY